MDSTELSVSEWKKKCQEEQVFFSKLLSDRIWDKFVKGKDDKYLFQKIALPLFGPPKKDAEDFGLTSEQKKLVDDIMEKCYKHSVDCDNTYVAVIFVFVRVNNGPHTFVPLIRVRNRANEDLRDVPNNIFIDHLGRVYESWRKYKEENTWERSCLCVPKDGYYSSEQEVEFINQSDRRNTRNLAIKTGVLNTSQSLLLTAKGLDTSSSISIFEVDGATERAISAPDGGESSPFESSTAEARNLWLRTLTIALSAETEFFTEALQKKAKEGELVPPETRAMVDALNVSRLFMIAAGLISSPTSNDNTILDSIEHIASSISFFTHDELTFKSANRIIEDAQDEKIKEMRESLNPEKSPEFAAILQGTKENVEKGKVEHIKGKAAFIKEMGNCVVDLDELFSQIKLLPNGQLNINDELTIHARAYSQMQQPEKDRLLRMSKMLRENKITVPEFNRDISDIQKKYRIRFDRQRFEGIEYLKQKFNVGDVSEINIGGRKLVNCKPEVLDRLENVVRNSFHGDPELIELANTFSQKQGVATVTEYCAAGEYVVRKVETEVKLLQQKNPNPTRGKGVKAKDHYKSMVVNELLKDGDKMKKLLDLFKNLCSVCDAANVGSPNFENSMAAANHYDKHPSFPKIDPNNNLSPERYIEIAVDMAGGPVTDIKWTQDGSALCCTFISKKYGATSIRYDNLANKTSVIATLMANKSIEIILIDSEAK